MKYIPIITAILALTLAGCSGDAIQETLIPEGIVKFGSCSGGKADRTVDIDLPKSSGIKIDNSTDTNKIAEILEQIDDASVKNRVVEAWLDCYEKSLPPLTELGCQAEIYETSRSSHVFFDVDYNDACLLHSKTGLLIQDPYGYYYFKYEISLQPIQEGNIGSASAGAQEIHFEPQWPRPAIFNVFVVSYPEDMTDVVVEDAGRRSLKADVHILASDKVELTE